MRKRLLTTSVCLIACTAVATGTASAANTIVSNQNQSSQLNTGNGSVSNDSEQSNSVVINQDNQERNSARVTQTNITRKIQVGNTTSSSTSQNNTVSINQDADADNSIRMRQRNSNRTSQRACQGGAPDREWSVQKSINVSHTISTPTRNHAISHQINVHIAYQRSC